MATGLPTLSQIHAWDVNHLIEAAEHWYSTADRWESVYGQVWQQAIGMDWHGQARDALIDRTTADRAIVIQKSDQLRDAALTARKGAGDISAAQRSVLYKVDDAHQAGFVVGGDLSLTDTQNSRSAAALAARQAQAQALAADIRCRAAQLVAADSEVGAKLTSTAGDVGSLNFYEKPVAHDGKIQLVDWKQAPPRNPARATQAKTSATRSKTFRKGPVHSLARFAASKTFATCGIGHPRVRHRPLGANTREPSVCYRTAPPSGCARVTIMDRRWKFGRLTSRIRKFTSMKLVAAYRKFHPTRPDHPKGLRLSSMRPPSLPRSKTRRRRRLRRAPHQNRLLRWGRPVRTHSRISLSRRTAIADRRYWVETTCPIPNSSHRDAALTWRRNTPQRQDSAMTTAFERVRKELLLGALEGPVPLTAVDSSVTQQNRLAPVTEVQNATLETIRSLVGEGLVVLGDLSGETGRLVAWSGSVEESMQKISDLYVVDYDDPGAWIWSAWLELTHKGEQVARALQEGAKDSLM
ncbi:MAG: hypothetical protein WA622_20290 [Mycobacterium sp.]|uniref:hypothetical protein n=1 Tax=Mycobacterium sp. TaxID=1785 RepID=UPI003C922E9D